VAALDEAKALPAKRGRIDLVVDYRHMHLLVGAKYIHRITQNLSATAEAWASNEDYAASGGIRWDF
tara:strand:- start:238 stop:435 length:198 start_codon:yes stop_codon:yes gene_type:complete